MVQAIFWISIFVVGVVEVIKIYLPDNFNSKITALISLALSLAASIGYGIYLQYDVLSIIKLSGAVIGLVQTSYNFILKLVKSAINWLKVKIALIASSEIKSSTNVDTTSETTDTKSE